jgi:hypothetical protein
VVRRRRRELAALSRADAELLERVRALLGPNLAELAAVNGGDDEETEETHRRAWLRLRFILAAVDGPRDGRESSVRAWRGRAALALVRCAAAGIGCELEEAVELRRRIVEDTIEWRRQAAGNPPTRER